MKIEAKRSRLKEIHRKVIDIRQHLHQYPELSFEEYETSLYIQKILKQLGIGFKVVSKTGIVGVIEPSKKTGKCIALRADIDALPILEENNTFYSSRHDGIMHACGHDVHTATLLGALEFINEHREDLNCQVKFIFQPGEEKLPGGASLLIKEGVLENPKVDEIYALHVFPELEVGKIGLREGMYMASCDEIRMEIIGKGGHGAMPHQNIDPILISAHIITALQQIISRNCNPSTPSVLSFGRIEGLGATNVIPNSVKLEGTFRTMSETWRKEAHQLIEKQTKLLAQSMGAEVDITIDKGYPFLKNDVQQTQKTRQLLANFFGPTNVIELPIRMTGEDFSYYAQKIPATFIRIGTRNEVKGITFPVHHSKFDIDDAALLVGMETFINIVFQNH